MEFVASQVDRLSAAPTRRGSARLGPPALELTTSQTYRIIDSGHALPFTALASPPTVTLPRLKALTTGANPTFLDAILNIAEDNSAAALENVDSWVRQLAIGDGLDQGLKRNVVFFGDDTWLRLFPKRWFRWQQGVSSFYVKVSSLPQPLSHTIETRVHKLASAFRACWADWDGLCRTRRRSTRT